MLLKDWDQAFGKDFLASFYSKTSFHEFGLLPCWKTPVCSVEVKLKNLGALFHFHPLCVWKSLLFFSLQTYVLLLWPKSSIFVLSIKSFSRKHLACPCGQLHVSVKLEGVAFKERASFLVGTLTVMAMLKLTSLWTVMLLLQQFPVHCRLESWSQCKF